MKLLLTLIAAAFCIVSFSATAADVGSAPAKTTAKHAKKHHVKKAKMSEGKADAPVSKK